MAFLSFSSSVRNFNKHETQDRVYSRPGIVYHMYVAIFLRNQSLPI